MNRHPNAPVDGKPSSIDRAYQLAYKAAYQLMRTYWKVTHPTTHGALVALWNQGEVLLVRNSYVPYYSAPGGYIRSGETSADAVVRELREEIGVDAASDQLISALNETHEWEGKQDHVEIFELELENRPEVNVDHREVIAASWYPAESALQLNLFPPLRKVIAAHVARAREP